MTLSGSVWVLVRSIAAEQHLIDELVSYYRAGMPVLLLGGLFVLEVSVRVAAGAGSGGLAWRSRRDGR